MASVTREFKENFDEWANLKQELGEFSKQEISELRELIRTDLTPGPDQLRDGCKYINDKGVEVPAMIDDHEERYKLWDNYFADELEGLREQVRLAA